MNERELLTIRAGVGLPLLQAAVTGIMLGFVTWGILRYFSVDNSGRIAVLVGGVVAVLAWLAAVAVWRRMAGYEEDVQPEIKETTVKIQTYSDDGSQIKLGRLPIDKPRLKSFAREVLSGRSLTEASWVGNGGLFSSRSEFTNFRDAMIAERYGRWVNPDCTPRGWYITYGGRSFLKYMANSPTPTDDKEETIRHYL